MKAGLMEIGDVFVINKSDRDGADTLSLALRTMLHLKMKEADDWEVKVIKTVGTQNKGIEELLIEILRHKTYLETNGHLIKKRKENLIKQINELVNDRLGSKFWDKKRIELLELNVESIINRETNPYDFVEILFKDYQF
jgi:LAO/AO transport system kinase